VRFTLLYQPSPGQFHSVNFHNPHSHSEFTRSTRQALAMKIARVTEFGKPPKAVEASNPPAPSANEVQIKLLATGVHRLVQSRAAGKHYSAQGLPQIPGVDGVGTTVPDGKLVYFSTLTPKGGSFQEILNVPNEKAVPVPEGADPVQVAGLLNPVMASWMGLATRTSDLPKGFSVLIVGVTSLSGSVAVSVARVFGAGKVYGCARSVQKMEALGLDGTIELKDHAEETDFSSVADVDVVLDFLYGPVIPYLFQTAKPTTPMQYVQIGTVISLTADLPGDVLRSKNITLRGTGPGAWSGKQFDEQLPKMLETLGKGKIKKHEFREVKLDDVEKVWLEKGERLVVVP
jgi:NADPH:quinone reductase-like Zn-dependent oxidoreductase